MNLGENIRFYRKERGYSSKKLGEKIGVSPQAILQYERGERTPNIDTIKKIANALNVPTLVLTEGENAIADLFANIAENQLEQPSKSLKYTSKGSIMEDIFKSMLSSEFIGFEKLYEKEEHVIKYLISKTGKYNDIELGLDPSEICNIFDFLVLCTDSKIQEILNNRKEYKGTISKLNVSRGMHDRNKSDLTNDE